MRVRALPETEKQKQMRLKESFATPSAKRAAHRLLQEESELTDEERAFINQLLDASPEIGRVRDLGQRFQKMVKEKEEQPFEAAV